MTDTPEPRPSRRVTFQAIGGACAVVVVGTAQMVYPGIEFPPGYEGALAVLFGALVAWVTRD